MNCALHPEESLEKVNCIICNGSGQVLAAITTEPWYQDCQYCKGEGYLEEECGRCNYDKSFVN